MCRETHRNLARMEPLLPRYYRFCLWLTVIECAVAFTVALAPWWNLVPLWITMSDAKELNEYERYVTSGYGFWAGLWAVPNFVMLRCKDVSAVRLFAKLAGFIYLAWWIMWWEEVWNGTWQYYVVVTYVPARTFQMVAHLWFGFCGTKGGSSTDV